MKGWLYAAELTNRWELRTSIALKADQLFWFNPPADGQVATRLLVVEPPLPLDVLQRALALVADEARPLKVDAAISAAALVRCAAQAWGESERGNGGGGQPLDHVSGLPPVASRPPGLTVRVYEVYEAKGKTGAELAAGGTAAGAGSGLGAAAGSGISAAASSGADAAAAGTAAEVWASAVEIADILQGRALLHNEALDLLAVAEVKCPADVSWELLLQLAALQGGLRLRSALSAASGAQHNWAAENEASANRQQRNRVTASGSQRNCETTNVSQQKWTAALAFWRWSWRKRKAGRLRCARCGSGEAHMRRTACAACGLNCAYCEACLGMGRARACGLLIIGRPAALLQGQVPIERQGQALPPLPTSAERLASWGLSAPQLAAAMAALRCIEAPASARAERFLLWAVTGAGKTEMIFPLIESVLLRGGRVLLATPRRDVVLELAPRIGRAFPLHRLVVLYGGSDQRWQAGDIVLSTTHQLLRFEAAFQLVIVDELDAFPYVNDPVLHYAAAKSCATGGVTVLLSATPPKTLQREARRGRLQHARVPARFHGSPLPVPLLMSLPTVDELLRRNRLPPDLLREIQASLKRGAQLFLFVARIRQVEPLVTLLQRCLGTATGKTTAIAATTGLAGASASIATTAIAGTSSQDAQRVEKVKSFRAREIRVLVTTTILERGVTIPRSDVFVLDAHAQLFDEASLVQMAGRAGRSADDPNGRVRFFAPLPTRAQRGAVRQIRTMNRMARRQGFLKEAARS